MRWYSGFNAFRSFTFKIEPKNSIRGSCHRIHHQHSPFTAVFFCRSKSSSFTFSSPALRNSGFQLGFSQNQHSPFLCGARRYYFADQRQVFRGFKRWFENPRYVLIVLSSGIIITSGWYFWDLGDPSGFKRWFENPKNVFLMVVLGSGVIVGAPFLIRVLFGKLETVPFTKRCHYVLWSRTDEKEIGEVLFEFKKEEYNGKILPAIHPESVRMRLIAKDIFQALERLLRKEKVCIDLGYASDIPRSQETSGNETVSEAQWHKEDEIVDDKCVQQSTEEGQEKGSWEVLVVNEPASCAYIMPGWKIFVYTGLLEYIRSDAEIATVLGHEIGHAVARHPAEWFNVWQAALCPIFPRLSGKIYAFLLRLPYAQSRKIRNEFEADHIGLMLMASAGYDPRLAPGVYEKLSQIGGANDVLTHPSEKERAQYLRQAKVMEEALLIYWENMDRERGVKVSLSKETMHTLQEGSQ